MAPCSGSLLFSAVKEAGIWEERFSIPVELRILTAPSLALTEGQPRNQAIPYAFAITILRKNVPLLSPVFIDGFTNKSVKPSRCHPILTNHETVRTDRLAPQFLLEDVIALCESLSQLGKLINPGATPDE